LKFKVIQRENKTMLASQDLQQTVGLKSEFEGFAWKGLFRVGGIAALLAGLIFRRNLGAELSLLKESGLITAGPTTPPSTVPAWYALLQSDPQVGLTWLNVFDLVNYALVGVMFLALFAALRRVSPAAMASATALGLIGIAIYCASNQALALLSLSDQYAAATIAAQRTMLLADGQVLLAINRFSSLSRYLSLLLIAVAGLMTSVVMLRSNVFSRSTAYTGILAGAFDLAYCLAFAFVLAVDGELLAVCFIPAAGLLLMIWHILIGQRLYRQGRITGKTQPQHS
jgi:Domain of unknown function (DUF4386)